MMAAKKKVSNDSVVPKWAAWINPGVKAVRKGGIREKGKWRRKIFLPIRYIK